MEQVRISKILSELGLCSRREADKYIEQGLVLLDGKVVGEQIVGDNFSTIVIMKGWHKIVKFVKAKFKLKTGAKNII